MAMPPKSPNGAETSFASELSAKMAAKAKAWAAAAKAKREQFMRDRRAQVTVASAVGGGAALGAGGAAVGLVSGGLLGGAVGILPALFTFGLSIPAGLAIGGGCGFVVGGAAGGTAGVTGGGAAGYGLYTYRNQIRSTIVRGWTTCTTFVGTRYGRLRARVVALSHASGKRTAEVATATKRKTAHLIAQKSTQVSAISAASGVVIGGAGGAVTGTLLGGALGAAAGLVPAIFTFGLSIPVFAVLGGGCGLVAGTGVGGTTGALVGGVSGYEIFHHRVAIRRRVDDTKVFVKRKASSSALFVKEKSASSVEFLRAKLKAE